jgi:hypothetical protein
MEDFLSAAPFNASEALLTLKRALRELRLSERGNGFEWKTQRILEAQLQDQAIAVRLARRPLASPDFESLTITSSAQLRQLTEELKRRLARWSDE